MTDVLEEAVTGAGLAMVFQRVVALPSETVVGYEALARWPALKNVSATDVFAHAARTDRLDRLDHACIHAAVQGALRGSPAEGTLLLVNCEPTTTHVEPADDPDMMRAVDRFNFTFELTERGLLANPRSLLRKVRALRSSGFAIALDDVGSHPDSLALLDIVAPEIVKLDMGLIQRQPDRLQTRTVAAIAAHHERTGATICAEGVETDEHLEQAFAYGATLGQGIRFGDPGEPITTARARPWPVNTMYRPSGVYPSTFDLAMTVLEMRTVREQTLTQLYLHIGRIALGAANPPIVLMALRHDDRFSAAAKTYFSDVAEKSPFVAIFSENLPAGAAPRARRVKLDRDDPLSRESTIVVLGPDTAAALVAREQRCPASVSHDHEDRRFNMAITFDREHVTAAARSLFDRLI